MHKRSGSGRPHNVHWVPRISIFCDRSLLAERAQQPWQAKHVVAMQVGDEDEVHMAELQGCLEQLVLSPFPTVKQPDGATWPAKRKTGYVPRH